MSLNVKEMKNENTGFTQPIMDAGVYPAYLAQVVGLGLQEQRAWEGKPKEPKQMVRFVYELADEFMIDEEGNVTEEPRIRGEDIPLNPLDNDQANSTKRYYAIDPEVEADGDWSKLVGKPIMITITATKGKGKHEGKVFNNIAGTATPRAKEVGNMNPMVSEPVVFDMYEPDIEVFMDFPTWIQDKVKLSLDYEGSELEALVDAYVPKEDDEKEAKKKKAPKEEAPVKEKEDTSPEGANSTEEDW